MSSVRKHWEAGPCRDPSPPWVGSRPSVGVPLLLPQASTRIAPGLNFWEVTLVKRFDPLCFHVFHGCEPWASPLHRWHLFIGLLTFHTMLVCAFSHCWVEMKYCTRTSRSPDILGGRCQREFKPYPNFVLTCKTFKCTAVCLEVSQII